MKVRNGYSIAASIILGVTILYWLFQAVMGILAKGGVGAVLLQSLIPAIIMIGLLYLSWRRPLLGGVLTATFGIIMAMYFLLAKEDLNQASFFLLPMCIPLALCGLLFIEADWSVRKRTA